jgi:predicted O-linked N-acetylglucosamine transferase (SPINDLY family)
MIAVAATNVRACDMNEIPYVTALQKIAAGNLQVGELVEVASKLSASGQIDQARQLYHVWIKGNPNHPLLYVVLFNCSALDSLVGDTNAAVEALKSSVSLNPDFLPAYINLGGFLERGGAPERAVELWRTGVNRSQPLTGMGIAYVTTALKQIARVMSDRQQIEGAETAVQQCLEITPNQGDLIEQFVALRLAQCKWPVIVGSERIEKKALVRGIHPLSTAVYTDDPMLHLSSSDRYVRQLPSEGVFNRAVDRRRAPVDIKARRMRVGYISSDLRDHAVGYLMAEFFELHGRKDIEVFAYYCGPESDGALTRRIKSAVEHWTDIRKMSDDDAAKKIADDGIDILVDVNGHTRDARTGVFARRPAPIIVNWLGYPGTMATPYHHYIIADDWIIPKGSEMYYSEKVVRLPCYQPNDRKRAVASTVPTRKDAGLPENAFVFTCFNGTHKINKFTFDRWMEILNRTPESVLWLLDASAETKARLGKYAAASGIASERIIYAPKIQNSMHLARYVLADLFLDTAPYGAHTTASDALWMGIPVLTLSGRSFAARVCGSLVRSAGLKDLVMSSPRDYVEKAVSLGRNKAAVAAYKASLMKNRDRSTLFNMKVLVEKIEALYRGMCEDHRKGRLPRPDLNNLAPYLEAGIGFDHEVTEMQAVKDYEGMYREALARLHAGRAIPADKRLWRAADIARAEKLLATPEVPVKAATVSRSKASSGGSRAKPAQKKRVAGRR